MVDTERAQAREAGQMVTIAIDPGSTSGLAVWVGDRCVHVERVTPAGYLDYRARSLAIRGGLRAAGVETGDGRADGLVWLVTEAQYVGQTGAVKSAQTVHAGAVAWEIIGSMLGCSIVEGVYPVSWRARYRMARATRQEAKAGARRIAQERLGLVVGDDVAEAVLLGLHVHLTRFGAVPPASLSWAAR